MKYFGLVAYCGTRYSGWQIQPNDLSVQQCLEEAAAKLFRTQVGITGCGRTDTGVHASCYFFHLECPEQAELHRTIRSFNALLPGDIHLSELIPVHEDAHARFDATHRTYRYYLTGFADPFREDKVFFFRQLHLCDFSLVSKAAEVIGRGEDFFAFAKSGSEVNHHRCRIDEIKWCQLSPKVWVFEITANRFLRGMVRLIVGACLNAGLGKITLEEIKDAVANQNRLSMPWSVPGHGLYLADIKYPYIPDKLSENSRFFEPFGPISKGI